MSNMHVFPRAAGARGRTSRMPGGVVARVVRKPAAARKAVSAVDQMAKKPAARKGRKMPVRGKV